MVNTGLRGNHEMRSACPEGFSPSHHRPYVAFVINACQGYPITRDRSVEAGEESSFAPKMVRSGWTVIRTRSANSILPNRFDMC
jgi:hypothetical protein